MVECGNGGEETPDSGTRRGNRGMDDSIGVSVLSGLVGIL